MSESISINTAAPAVGTATSQRRFLPKWISFRVMAGVWLVLVIYGTLVPFNFDLPESFGGVAGFFSWVLATLTSPRWLESGANDISSLGTPNWVNDIALNGVLYGPLAGFLRLHFKQRGRSWWGQIGLTMLAVLGISWLLECTQSRMADRFAGINDICTNTAGGLVGALVAAKVCNAARITIFWMYCRVSYVLYKAKIFYENQRRKPFFMFAAVLTNIGLVAYWYAAAAPAGDSGESAANWLPFAQQFKRSYDVAALQIGRSLIIYCLFAMILSLQFMRIKHRKGFGWVVLAVAVLAAAREVIELTTAGESADITEPIIALMAVGFITTTTFLLYHAVRCSCRRKTQVPVDVDRRRVPHSYDD